MTVILPLIEHVNAALAAGGQAPDDPRSGDRSVETQEDLVEQKGFVPGGRVGGPNP
ncbi:MAG: hypothetical protein U0X73_15760 [Thermoanaerobaculia bacterium]